MIRFLRAERAGVGLQLRVGHELGALANRVDEVGLEVRQRELERIERMTQLRPSRIPQTSGAALDLEGHLAHFDLRRICHRTRHADPGYNATSSVAPIYKVSIGWMAVRVAESKTCPHTRR